MKWLLQPRIWLLLSTTVCAGCVTAQPVTVTIHSIPTEAALLIDGNENGMTPKEVVLANKTHRIELRKNEYETLDAYIAPRPRSLLTHIFTFGVTLYNPDVLEDFYTFSLKKAAKAKN